MLIPREMPISFNRIKTTQLQSAKRISNKEKKFRKKKFKNSLVSCGTLGILVQGTGKAHKLNLPSAK